VLCVLSVFVDYANANSREKWTLFEEATRVPLLIAHPQSPFKGQHYKQPTESIDIYATLDELLKLPVERATTCGGFKCKPLQGKSLAPVILGTDIYEKNFGSLTSTAGNGVFGKIKSMFSSNHAASTKPTISIPRKIHFSRLIGVFCSCT
jgi:hypothetical protein